MRVLIVLEDKVVIGIVFVVGVGDIISDVDVEVAAIVVALLGLLVVELVN